MKDWIKDNWYTLRYGHGSSLLVIIGGVFLLRYSSAWWHSDIMSGWRTAKQNSHRQNTDNRKTTERHIPMKAIRKNLGWYIAGDPQTDKPKFNNMVYPFYINEGTSITTK